MLAFFVALVKSNFGIAQNPMVISDSLIVQQRLYAKEKLIVDQEAKFKQDIVVQGDARMKSDVRIDSVLRVDGNARFNGNVRMDGIGEAPSLDSTIQVLVVLPNGQVKKTTIPGLGIYGAYQPIYCPPGDVPNPNWQNGLNKIFSPCPPVNVGIGTSDPLHKLHVVGNTYSRTFLAGNTGATYAALFNGFALNSSQDLMRLGIKIGGLTEEIRFRIENDGNIILDNSGSEASLVINNGTGHAMIVYANNGTKILQLEDNGMMRAREIKVDQFSWPDYVFDQKYKLPKLSDVAKYIEKNHHLPGVPSAKEIESDGLNLGDMQKIQMQKIEELTLYLIEMEKRIEVLEKENEELKKINR